MEVELDDAVFPGNYRLTIANLWALGVFQDGAAGSYDDLSDASIRVWPTIRIKRSKAFIVVLMAADDEFCVIII